MSARTEARLCKPHQPDRFLLFSCTECGPPERELGSAIGHLRYEHGAYENDARMELALAAYRLGLEDGMEIQP